jgi:hypothetical protein
MNSPLRTIQRFASNHARAMLALLTTGSAGCNLAPAPTLVRVGAALPILVLVAGWALAAFLGAVDPRGRSAETHLLADVVLPLVLGVVALLAVVVGLAAAGRRLTPATIAIAVAGFTLVLLAGIRGRGTAASGSRPPTGAVAQRVLAIVAAAVLLAGAVVGARSMQPVHREWYTNTVLTGPRSAITGQISATAGEPVTLTWMTYSYGFILPDAAPDVVVTFSGREPLAGHITVEPPTAPVGTTTSARSSQAGTLVFTAPDEPGRDRIAITVTSARPDDVPPGPADQLDVDVTVRP